jgi:hypothetical protein
MGKGILSEAWAVDVCIKVTTSRSQLSVAMAAESLERSFQSGAPRHRDLDRVEPFLIRHFIVLSRRLSVSADSQIRAGRAVES